MIHEYSDHIISRCQHPSFWEPHQNAGAVFCESGGLVVPVGFPRATVDPTTEAGHPPHLPLFQKGGREPALPRPLPFLGALGDLVVSRASRNRPAGCSRRNHRCCRYRAAAVSRARVAARNSGDGDTRISVTPFATRISETLLGGRSSHSAIATAYAPNWSS